MSQQRFDVCIIGAGIAGSALAFAFAKQGRSVVVIERDLSEPEKIIGELLQPGGVQKLKELGYQNLFDGLDSIEIEGYGLFKDGVDFKIAYPKRNGETIKGRGFRYGKFVMRLRERAGDLPNVTFLEGTAKGFIRNEENEIIGVRFLPTEEQTEQRITAQLTIACDGGSSLFSKELNRSEKIIKGYFLGLLLEDCPLPYPNYGHVFIAGSSPFLSYPISSKHTRVLIDFPADAPPQKGQALERHIAEKVLPFMPTQMHPAMLKAVKDNPFRAMPNCEVVADPVRVKGALLLGDSLNMRHPITGGGMTVALSDVKFLTDLLSAVDLHDETATEKAIDRFYNERHLHISTINILANALYDVFSHDALSEACFEYLRQGGKMASEPVQLLSALSRDRKLLITHFMAVARSGASRKLRPFPTPKRMKEAQAMMSDAIDILQPQLRNEHFGSALDGVMKLAKLTLGTEKV